jgi:hypothetical protein
MQEIETIGDVVRQLQVWKEQIGLGFHCDENGRDYINVEARERTFTDQQADEYDALIARCFEICDFHNVDFHELALVVISEPILKSLQESAQSEELTAEGGCATRLFEGVRI